MAARGHRRHADGDRLQPEQPDRHALPLGADRRVRRARCRATSRVILDEAYVEFSTLQDPDESLDLLERHPNLVLLRTFSKVYGLCGLRVGYALGSEEFRLARRPRAPAVLGQRARPGRRDRGAQPPGRGRAPRASGPRSSGCTWSRSWASAGSRPPTARPTSPGSRSATATRTRSSTGSPKQRRDRARRRGARAGRAGCASPTAPRPENDRFLAALDQLV